MFFIAHIYKYCKTSLRCSQILMIKYYSTITFNNTKCIKGAPLAQVLSFKHIHQTGVHCTISMKKAPLLYHQFVLLEETFSNHNVPLQEIGWYYDSFVPSNKYNNADELKLHIIKGGSSYFNGFVNACKKANLNDLVISLSKEDVCELYRFVWIWSEDQCIQCRGKSWFTSKEDCATEARKARPKYYTFDGPDAPEMILGLESTCPCFVHTIDDFKIIAPECFCYQPKIPEEFANKDQITIDALNIVRIISNGPMSTYLIKESSECFSSCETSIYLAYLHHKRHMINVT